MRTLKILFVSFIAILLSGKVVALNGEEAALVTVAGKISKPNRSPIDEFKDAYFKSEDVAFKKAHAFNLSALKALGFHKKTVSFKDWPKTYTFEGPLLKDVLKAAGANGKTIFVKALDGYAAEIPVSDTKKYPIILALKMDGKYLDIGGRGPAWVVYPRNDFKDLQKQDDSKYVWSVYFIEVK